MGASRISIRQVVVYVAGIGVLLLARPVWPTYLIGCAMAALGIAIRVWGCGHLRKNRELITSGPYAHVQHPLYLGTFLITVGAIIAAGSPEMPSLLLWVIGGPMFLIGFFGYYLPKKKRKEYARLAERFPQEAPEFARSVPAFVPSPRRYAKAVRQRWSAATFWENNEIGMDVLIAALFAIMIAVPRLVSWS